MNVSSQLQTRAHLNTLPLLSCECDRQGLFWTHSLNFKSTIHCFVMSINHYRFNFEILVKNFFFLAQISCQKDWQPLQCPTRLNLAGNHLKCFIVRNKRRGVLPKQMKLKLSEFLPITICGRSESKAKGNRNRKNLWETWS